jgi:hypothetical protein
VTYIYGVVNQSTTARITAYSFLRSGSAYIPHTDSFVSLSGLIREHSPLASVTDLDTTLFAFNIDEEIFQEAERVEETMQRIETRLSISFCFLSSIPVDVKRS